ncbi:MAG: c-type cytochrome domain-containing protein [Anaerolineales bacterium]
MKKILIGFLLIGFLAACGTQPTEAPASSPTGDSVSPTSAPAATETAVPATDAATPTVVIPTTPPTETSAQTGSISFVNDVVPILQSRCWKCHGGEETKEGLDLTTFASIMAGSENGSVVTPGDVENSLLAEQVVSQEMPKRGPKLTPPQVQIIVDWIQQGALNN